MELVLMPHKFFLEVNFWMQACIMINLQKSVMKLRHSLLLILKRLHSSNNLKINLGKQIGQSDLLQTIYMVRGVLNDF